MNERELILNEGEQPVPSISNKELSYLIVREFPNDTGKVKSKLSKIRSDSKSGKNRISASVLKLANQNLDMIDILIKRANEDFRDIVSEAEYPRAHMAGFELFDKEDKVIKEVFLQDWEEYSTWTKKK